MSKIFCMTDIHGYAEALDDALKVVFELFGGDDKLIFLGDYIDGGSGSRQVIERIMELQQRFPERVIALKGNHEEFLTDFISGDYSILEIEPSTWQSFIGEESDAALKKLAVRNEYGVLSELVRREITKKYGAIVGWLKELPLYYETDAQIFVHAGIDEELGKDWWIYTPDEYFTGKYPITTGKFLKDIIAGHVGTASITGNKDFHGIWHDGASHYFCDGNVAAGGVLPILVYDTETGKYASPNSEICIGEFD